MFLFTRQIQVQYWLFLAPFWSPPAPAKKLPGSLTAECSTFFTSLKLSHWKYTTCCCWKGGNQNNAMLKMTSYPFIWLNILFLFSLQVFFRIYWITDKTGRHSCSAPLSLLWLIHLELIMFKLCTRLTNCAASWDAMRLCSKWKLSMPDISEFWVCLLYHERNLTITSFICILDLIIKVLTDPTQCVKCSLFTQLNACFPKTLHRLREVTPIKRAIWWYHLISVWWH